MRLSVKNVFCYVASICLLASLFVGCDKSSVSSKSNEIVYCVTGDEPKDLGIVLNKINEKLEKEVNAKVQFKFLNNDTYNLMFSSGEKFDLIAAPDWLNYWDNAAKGAFTEITDKDLQENAPYLSSIDKKYLNASKLNGKRYAIARIGDDGQQRCWIVRGDILAKSGLTKIETIDDFGVYLDTVTKYEKGLIPYDVGGSTAWQTAAMYYYNLGWTAPGNPTAISPYFMSLTDSSHKIFNVIDTKELRDFSMKMKEWSHKGYWSRSAMTNKIDSLESFKNGRSASAFGYLSDAEAVYNEFQKDERKAWGVTAFPVYNKYSVGRTYMNNAVAISATSGNKELALKVLDKLYGDKELYRLLTYGIEGIHYNVVEENHKVALDNVSYSTMYYGIENEDYKLTDKYNMPSAENALKVIKAAYYENPLINFRRDLTNLSEIEAYLNNIYSQYGAPRFLGFVEDVDAAIATEKEKLKEAGIDTYIEAIQKQINEYLKNNN